MSQATLNKWLNIKEDFKIKTIFYLEWTDYNYPNFNAIWLDKLPQQNNFNFIKKINWKDINTEVTICGNIIEYERFTKEEKI